MVTNLALEPMPSISFKRDQKPVSNTPLYNQQGLHDHQVYGAVDLTSSSDLDAIDTVLSSSVAGTIAAALVIKSPTRHTSRIQDDFYLKNFVLDLLLYDSPTPAPNSRDDSGREGHGNQGGYHPRQSIDLIA